MPDRHFGVRPDLDQLRHQAKDLLREIKRGDPSAIAELNEHHPEHVEPSEAKLADAQLALARSYGVPSWPRIVHACQVIDAIWRDDIAGLKALVVKHPHLLHEMASGTKTYNWGAPMTYAANLGRDNMIAMLHDQGAKDHESAVDRAVLQGQTRTAKKLFALGARQPRDVVMGPAETLSGSGMAFALAEGAEIMDRAGNRLAPVALALETYSRNPPGKHQIMELFAEHGVALPDTPPMAVHRGRIDLLEAHLRRDPALFARTFSHQEIYPPELGCQADESLGIHGTPLAGATLLHMAIDYDEREIVQWLIDRGFDVNARALLDAEGFGGHTALFGCVIWQPKRQDADFARLLLDQGADPNTRASLRKCLRFVGDELMHEYRDVTPLSWGGRFHERDWVNEAAMKLIRERGGRE